jgi:hypothetical protein
MLANTDIHLDQSIVGTVNRFGADGWELIAIQDTGRSARREARH